MATIINISSITQYYNTNKVVKTGTAADTGSGSAAAISAATRAAQSAANNAHVGGGTPSDGGSSSSTALFGSTYGDKATSTGSATITNVSGATYTASCKWTATRTSTMYQVKLKFTLPSGVAADKIASATLAFTGTSSVGNAKTFRVCAPTTTEQTSFQKYSTATSFSTSVGVNFNSAASTAASPYSFSITDVFKQCITNSQGWITLLIPIDTVEEEYPTITISGTPTISYELNYTYCTAPTSVTAGAAIQKPGAAVTISWSGASGGTNNAISSYILYYNAGSSPTENSSQVSVTTTSYNFTIPSNASRTSTYYFKVKTIGSAGYNSGLSTAQASVKVNQLPNAPTVSASPTRIKSTGSTTVTFTVTAGATNDTGQTASLYYATSATGTKEPFTSPLKKDLSATTTYYFWTSDGLEFSSAASAFIIKNTPPTIGSITMSAYNGATYSPSVRDGYVKNINGSASNVTGTNISYQWKLLIGSGSSATSTNITTSASFTNVDVTAYGATFNTTYQLALVVTDDLGESATAYSSTVYGIPAAPTITIYNQKSNGNKGGNTNNAHFEDGIRINYSANNTGLTRILEYSTSSNFSSYSTMALSGTSYSDVTLTGLTRGTTYYFRVKYTCNTVTTTTAVSSGYMRANDIAPNISAITPQSGTVIKPYTQSLLNFTFTNSPISWAAAQDVATSYGSIYSIKLKYSTRSLNVTSFGTNSNGTVTGTVTLSSITTASWKTLLGTTNAPNATYTITLEITATNGFGAAFVGTKTFNANFIEGIYTIGTPSLSIKTGNGANDFTTIPIGYNNATTFSRYHIFEGQILRVSLSGLQCYANQTARIYFIEGTTALDWVDIAANEWSAPSGTSHLYTLSGTKIINYTVPFNSNARIDDGSNNKNYYVKVVLENGNSKTSIESGQNNGNLNSCFHMRFTLGSINFKINNVNDSQQEWTCSDWGGLYSGTNYSTGYSSIKIRELYSTSATGTYNTLGGSDSDGGGSSGIFYNNIGNISGDILYFGVRISLTLNYQPVVAPGSSATTPLPINSLNDGQLTYTKDYTRLYTYYRDTPNLLYGKNFFCLNQNAPQAHSNQLLEISTARYTTDGGVQMDRDTIYFGTDGTNFKINSSYGLVIDCGSW